MKPIADFSSTENSAVSPQSVWTWDVNVPSGGGWTQDGDLVLTLPADDPAVLTLRKNPKWGDAPLRCSITGTAKSLEVRIDPSQTVASISKLDIIGEFGQVVVSSPVWTGDPTELGTATIDDLRVEIATDVFIGGDLLTIDKIGISRPIRVSDLSELHDPHAWDHLRIIDDSRVEILSPPSSLALSIGDRSLLTLGPSVTELFLGSLGVDAELDCLGTSTTILGFKVEQYEGNEQVRLLGVDRLNFDMLRVLVRASESKPGRDCRAGRGHLSWLARRGGLEGCCNAQALSAGVPRRCREGRSESPRGGHARADRR